MKKLLAAILSILSIVTVFAFAGCGGDTNSNQAKSGNVALEVEKVAFTASGEYMAISETTSVKSYMDALAENGELVYTVNNGFVQSFYNTASKVVSSTVNSYEGYDWSFYIDFTTLEGDSAIYATDYKTIEYGGKTLYFSNNGVEGTPCIDGHTYVFVYEYSNFSW